MCGWNPLSESAFCTPRVWSIKKACPRCMFTVRTSETHDGPLQKVGLSNDEAAVVGGNVPKLIRCPLSQWHHRNHFVTFTCEYWEYNTLCIWISPFETYIIDVIGIFLLLLITIDVHGVPFHWVRWFCNICGHFLSCFFHHFFSFFYICYLT